MATATESRSAPGRERAGVVARAELREALDRTLAEVDADDRLGPIIKATRLRLRFELTDADLALNVRAAEDDRNLAWSFDADPGWSPKLVLTMSSAVANRYLLGRESIAIAIARGEVRCRGDSRAALHHLPAARLLADRYRAVVEAEYPALAAA